MTKDCCHHRCCEDLEVALKKLKKAKQKNRKLKRKLVRLKKH